MIAKRITLLFVTAVLLAASVMTANAETIYKLNGYAYSILDNESIVLEGWDTGVSATLALPDGLADRKFTGISNWAFENNTGLTGLDLSNADHLGRIGYECFMGCSNIATPLVLPESLNALNERSFCECVSVPSLEIRGEVKTIPVECFFGCTSLKSAVLPKTLQSIRDRAFCECTELEYVEIPQSLTSISETAFMNDPALTLGVWYGTCGHSYAREQEIPFIFLDGVLLGDANADDCISISDATAVQRHLVSLNPLEGVYEYAADVNKDGDLDISDVTVIQKYLAKYDLNYPIGKSI